jgi:hypothetical protein
MQKMHPVVPQLWTVSAAILILGSAGLVGSEPWRAFASFLCIALLIHYWFVQRKRIRSLPRLVFLTLVLSLPALTSLWLGLNVIRYYSYTGDEASNVYSEVI